MAFVNGTSASNYTGTTFSASPAAAFACTAGNLICVAVCGWAPSGQTVSSVTDTAGNTYAKIGSVKYGNNVQVEYWFAYNIAGHATNVVQANWSAPTAYWAICAVQRSGHPTTNPLGVSTTPYVQAAGVGFAISPIFTTSQANEAVVSFTHVDASSTTWSAGSIGPQAITLQGAPLTLRTAVSGAQNVIQFQDGEYGAVLDNVSVIAINNNTANAKAIFVATFKTTAAPADFGTIPVRVTQDALTALASRAGEVGTMRVTQESLTALVDLGTPSATVRVSQTALTVLVSRSVSAGPPPLTVSVADSIAVADRLLIPLRVTRSESCTVTDAAFRGTPLPVTRNEPVTVTESARRQYPPRVRDDCIVRESVTAQLYALKVFLSLRETISVSESRQRAVTTSRMEVKVFDYIRTIDAKTAAIYGTVWDGSGTPPPPTPGVFDDYWLVGTGVGGINFAPGHLFRDGSYFNPLASWTVTLWARPHTDAPGPGAYRQEWFFGSASYIYLGSNFASNDVILEVSDGVSYFDSVTVPLPLGQWKHLAITHDAVTHALQLYVNDRLMGTMHYDLSTFAGDWGSTEEAGTMSWGNLELAQIRVWQATLNQLEISAEARALSAVRKAGLLADTPIPTVDRRVDLSGHGHTWLGSGSLFTVTGPQATLDPVPRFPKGVVMIAAPSQVHSLGQPVTLNCPVISSDYTVERLADGRTDRVMRAAWETMAITIDCGEPCTPNLLGVLGHNIDHGRVIGVTNDAGLARGFGGRDPNCWIDLRGFPTTARYWTVFVNVNSVPVSMCEVVIATATVFEDGFWEGEFTEQVKYPGYRDQTEFLKTYLSASGAINRSASPNVRLSEEDRVKLAAITEEVMTTGGRVLVVPSSLINDIWYCEWPPLEELTYPNQRLRTLSLPLYEPPSSLVNGR